LEVVVACTVLFAMFYTLYMKYRIQQYEPYVDGVDDNFMNYETKDEYNDPVGKMSEGFEGAAPASAVTNPIAPPPPAPTNAAPAAGAPAPTVATNAVAAQPGIAEAVKTMTGLMGGSNALTPALTPAGKATTATPAVPATVPATVPAKAGFANQSDEFQSATGSLFKLGKMPSEHAEGPRLDAGQTIMKAMSSFDPKTISAMTSDTKKLLETQKGLMQMLTQMRPVLADGKELLNTFTGMFGGGAPGGV
jgi:hypothetical protein